MRGRPSRMFHMSETRFRNDKQDDFCIDKQDYLAGMHLNLSFL